MSHKVQNKNDFSLFTPAEKLFVCNLKVAKEKVPHDFKGVQWGVCQVLPTFLNSVTVYLVLSLVTILLTPPIPYNPMANQTPHWTALKSWIADNQFLGSGKLMVVNIIWNSWRHSKEWCVHDEVNATHLNVFNSFEEHVTNYGTVVAF